MHLVLHCLGWKTAARVCSGLGFRVAGLEGNVWRFLGRRRTSGNFFVVGLGRQGVKELFLCQAMFSTVNICLVKEPLTVDIGLLLVV